MPEQNSSLCAEANEEELTPFQKMEPQKSIITKLTALLPELQGLVSIIDEELFSVDWEKKD